ncbi:hypothetical protein DFA_11212 [Cavenderia fasciculata]|uniref:Uncharacterized protein n=1 Tax=Cavenderia fasciculata TaxID=261658 RepID=F4QFE4_CACFS|nr:uncharacterized protein DFA_11212 [Cavenderia fasciculata]EGG13451.1 hypothetical protein DFA_11212 [Cavenderia fasciculata]|eukprot:XP_004350155.1 hypothetical protein DFA_11212 [Cavenderia fasciculata]
MNSNDITDVDNVQDVNKTDQIQTFTSTSNSSTPPSNITTTTLPTDGEKKKKKNKKNKKKSPEKTFIQPGEYVKGLTDEKDHIYNYGNVFTVKGADTSKPWTEETLGKYLKDAGFVRGSDTMPYLKAALSPLYLKFAFRLNQDLERTGHGQTDLDMAYSIFGDVLVESDHIPSSFSIMVSLFVAAAYIIGLPRFGRGDLPNVVKKTLVKMNQEIPRKGVDIGKKIEYTFNKYFGFPDQHRFIEWDLAKMNQYLKFNSVKQFTTTKYPPTEHNLDRVGMLCKMVMAIIIAKDINNKDTQQTGKDPIEMELESMGRMILPLWNSKQDWMVDLKIDFVAITLLAFQTGVVNFIYPPLIDPYVKLVILNQLDHGLFNIDDSTGEIMNFNVLFLKLQKSCSDQVIEQNSKEKKNTNKNKKKKKQPTLVEDDIYKVNNTTPTQQQQQQQQVKTPPRTVHKQEHIYNYGNVIDVKIDTNKNWTAAIFAQYLKDAGFVRGTDYQDYENEDIGYEGDYDIEKVVDQYIDFADKVMWHINNPESNPGISLKFGVESVTDFQTFSTMLPPTFKIAATLLAVSTFMTGLPEYCQPLPNVIKHTLVRMNKGIPRNLPDLIIKTQEVLDMLKKQHKPQKK